MSNIPSAASSVSPVPGGCTPPPASGPGSANNGPGSATKRLLLTSDNAGSEVLDKKRLQELVKEIDPNEQLDEDVETLLLHIADDFIEQTVTTACALAKHRKANTVEVEDVQFVLEKNWNLWIPGFGVSEIRQKKRSAATEAHKSRMALIKKALRKY